MRPEDEELSPAAIAALLGLMGGFQHDQVQITDLELAQYAGGTATVEQRDQVVAALVESPELRAKAILFHREMRRLASVPFDELDDVKDVDPVLIQTSRQNFRRSIELYGSLRNWTLHEGWINIRKGLALEAIAAQATLASIGKSFMATFSSPRFAAVRGSEAEFVQEGPFPPGVTVRLFIDLLENGTLQAQAIFNETVPDAANSLENRPLYLEILDPAGGTFPIGQATVQGNQWQFNAEGFAKMTSLPPGSVSASMFRLTIGAGPVLVRHRNHLFADVPGDIPVVLELIEEPRIEDGSLVVTLAASETTRARFSEYKLELLVPIGSTMQKLGAWAMSSWTEEQRTFRVPLPGIEDGTIECGSILQARLATV